jgi:alpha-beta hydrolase superfamily lysophospholipase
VSTDSFTFTSDDGTEIYVHVWQPEGDTKAVVQLAHGMGEHAGRFSGLAENLVKHGYAVYANDHRGHGLSIRSGEEPGHMGEDNVFERAIDDVRTLSGKIAEKHKGVPRFLLGHSMGSFMVQRMLIQHSDCMDAAILSATNGKPPAIAAVGRLVARVERFRIGKTGKSPVINALSFKEFNSKFKPNRTEFDWLSRDEAQVDAYIDDPLCGFIVGAQSWIDMLDHLGSLTEPPSLAQIPKDIPIYILAGTSDAVGDMGAGVMRLVHAYGDAGLRNVEVKLYPGGRHEMLHETNRDEVVDDLIVWLEQTYASLV